MQEYHIEKVEFRQFRQLLENLLDNALKYSSDAIDLVVSSTGQNVQVSVKDRGLAIAPERHDTIFQPYSRDDHAIGHGAGLGLALCRAIATAHGGHLELRRRNAGGNSFTLTLPIEPQPQRAQQP